MWEYHEAIAMPTVFNFVVVVVVVVGSWPVGPPDLIGAQSPPPARRECLVFAWPACRKCGVGRLAPPEKDKREGGGRRGEKR